MFIIKSQFPTIQPAYREKKMTDYSPPRGNKQAAGARKDSKPELPNAVDRKRVSTLIAKKRHMSGLMCPPMGVLPLDADDQRLKH